MSKEKRRPIHPNILFPGALLLLEAIVIIIFLVLDIELTPFLLVVFILLGGYMIFQIIQHLMRERQVRQAVAQLNEAEKLAKTGKPLEAIRMWKKLLQNLPKTKYLQVLDEMEQIYQELDMTDAVQQVKAIHSESLTFFDMTSKIEKVTPKDQQLWQAKAKKLGIMIKALPTEKNQDLSDVTPEE